jgi:heme exporter protein A
MSSRQAPLPSINVDNVAVIRGNRLVLRGLSVTARSGDIIWVRGANGCGKSTLLRLIAGLLHATAGSIMDLQGLAQVPVRFLSTGQRKRASIARVLTSKADIWLLDEPYNGLDSASCARLDQAITAHAANGGIVLVAAHQPPSINVAHSLILDRPEADA